MRVDFNSGVVRGSRAMPEVSAVMDVFGPSELHQYQVRLWGWSRFGIARVSIYTPKDNDDRWSIWLVMIWQFSFGGSFPRERVSRSE